MTVVKNGKKYRTKRPSGFCVESKRCLARLNDLILLFTVGALSLAMWASKRFFKSREFSTAATIESLPKNRDCIISRRTGSASEGRLMTRLLACAASRKPMRRFGRKASPLLDSLCLRSSADFCSSPAASATNTSVDLRILFNKVTLTVRSAVLSSLKLGAKEPGVQNFSMMPCVARLTAPAALPKFFANPITPESLSKVEDAAVNRNNRRCFRSSCCKAIVTASSRNQARVIIRLASAKQKDNWRHLSAAIL